VKGECLADRSEEIDDDLSIQAGAYAPTVDAEPKRSSKVPAAGSPAMGRAAPESPTWYVLRTNRYLGLVIPETAPLVSWRLAERLAFNVVPRRRLLVNKSVPENTRNGIFLNPEKRSSRRYE